MRAQWRIDFDQRRIEDLVLPDDAAIRAPGRFSLFDPHADGDIVVRRDDMESRQNETSGDEIAGRELRLCRWFEVRDSLSRGDEY